VPKNAGGLGFRKTKDFNTTLVAQFSWMIASKKESLCTKVLRNKYKVSDHWLRQQQTKGASPVWKAIAKARDLINQGVCYLVGDGNSINVWKDLWIPWSQNFKPTPIVPGEDQEPMLVSNLIHPSTRRWKVDLLINLFEDESVEAILKIKIPQPLNLMSYFGLRRQKEILH
jgi:hypothetical protein